MCVICDEIYHKHTHTHTHTHGLHTNTHTDCTKHTHGLHTNTHILLPIVVFAIETWTKTHTYLERTSLFFRMGAPATINIFAFLAHPGRPRHCKIRYFWHPGNTFTNNSHTHLPPGAPQTRKNTYIWFPGAPQTRKNMYFWPPWGVFQPLHA